MYYINDRGRKLVVFPSAVGTRRNSPITFLPLVNGIPHGGLSKCTVTVGPKLLHNHDW